MNKCSAYGYALSLWASKNMWPARILLVLGHFLLVVVALFVGAVMSPLPGDTTAASQLFFLLVAAGITVRYTIKSRKVPHTWASRKRLEGGMLACGMALMVLLGNGTLEQRIPAPVTAASAATTVTEKPVGQHQSKVRNWVRRTVQHYVAWPLWVKILVAVLIFICALFASATVLALGCSLACDGSEVLANIVLLLGRTGIVVGTTFLYMWLFRGKEKQELRDAERARRRAERLQKDKELDATP